MKPAWDSLAKEYANSDKLIVADVDCTAEGKDLCEKYGVQGFPTIKYFNPPDDEGEDYEGGRDLDALKEFAKTLGPGCARATKGNCSPEQLKELEPYLAMPEAERLAEVEKIKAAIKAAEEEHEKFVEGLQAQYEESNKKVESFKKENAPTLKLLKSAAPAKSAEKDEV